MSVSKVKEIIGAEVPSIEYIEKPPVEVLILMDLRLLIDDAFVAPLARPGRPNKQDQIVKDTIVEEVIKKNHFHWEGT
jgi:hypothetical protein